MRYPARVIKKGEADAAIVKAIKQKLNSALGIKNNTDERLDPDNPHFGERMFRLVKLFQARNVDGFGMPLKQDGEIGSLTWEALFGEGSVGHTSRSGDRFLDEVLRIAVLQEQNKVREKPRNSNKGPEVDEYLRRAGVWPGLAWCAAFVYWCCDEAAISLSRSNPVVRTAGCLDHWRKAPAAGATRIKRALVKQDPSLVRPGMIFIQDHGRGLGHTGLIESVSGGLITTIEGNTDASKTREGGGVYRLKRKIVDVNTGFISYHGI